jgi:hypothetical protein
VPKLYVCAPCQRGWSGRFPQHDAVWNFAGGDHAPERDEQLACKGNDHLGLVRPFDTLGPAAEPLRQSAVLLEQQEAPGELDQAAANPCIARFGEAFLTSLGSAFIRCSGEPGIASDCPAITQVARAARIVAVTKRESRVWCGKREEQTMMVGESIQ